MSLGTLLLAIWLILMGLNQLGTLAISATVLSILALLAGIIYLVEAIHPLTVFRRT